jgi:catechol 2,3-dioxygenase-like lactoylglutathione lyase family enzyme
MSVAPEREILGLHHVHIPVTDAWVSQDWYMDILGFKPVLVSEEENGVIGVVLRHPQGVVIGLHNEPARARALRGFVLLGLTVADQLELRRWAERFQRLGLTASPIQEGHLGGSST